MKNIKEDNNSSHSSSEKTNSSSFNDETEDSPKFRQRFRAPMNNNFKGRKTVAVPLYSFSGISHEASFKSKLQFFNSKAHQKPQNNTLSLHNAIQEEPEKKENKYKKNNFNKEDKNKKTKNDNDDIDSNININQILDSKDNNNNTNNNNENNPAKRYKTLYKKNSVCYSMNQYHTLQSDAKLNTFDNPKTNIDKKPKELKRADNISEKSPSTTHTETTNEQCTIQLKSLKDQWYYQKILLDYNILDFTSKYLFL